MAGDLMDEAPDYLHFAVSSSSSSSRVASTSNSVVVGLDGDVMAIKDRLCGMSSELEVIPILGMDGIGKTTLARTLYDDPLIIEYFHIRVWVTISQHYRARKVVLGFLNSERSEEAQRFREEITDDFETDDFTKVYKRLKGWRYLIVMDDVWSPKVWDDMRNAFPDDGNGSRIMLTTRLPNIASYVDSNSPPHQIKLMDVSQSWDLLKRKVFADNSCPRELEDVGKEIAKRHIGLPLDVVLVAGILSTTNKTPSSWEEISRKAGQGPRKILSLSYTHLPHHLRLCFLSIGLFREHKNICVSKLIRFWLAEGFLSYQNECSKSLEAEAEEYLEDLIMRNLVIVTSRETDGKIKCCGVHDLVRDWCIWKAHDEKIRSFINKIRPCWQEIAENVYPIVGRELEEILSLSYTYLTHHLRSCFLYVGGFLQHVNIHTSRLVRLWIAEGFLKHQNGCCKSLEDEAEEYLEELVKRNLVMVTSRKSNGKIKSCSLHDMVRDMCIKKAHDEDFLHVMDGCDLPQGLMNERRISFSRFDADDILGPTFRTILCFQIPKFSSWLNLLGSYKLLRVLDALGVYLKELPFQVFDLYHLRYLALMGSFSIPSAVSNLVNLQTLIIHLASGRLQGRHGDDDEHHSLALEIWLLPQLRHLFFHSPHLLPNPFQGLNLTLENLQTLLLVADLVWDEKILQLIPNVKRLGLTYTTSQTQSFNLHHLQDLHQLEKLEVIRYGRGFLWTKEIFPSFPRTLKKLTLVGGGFPWKNMAIVGFLPNLEILKLLRNACYGTTWEAHDDYFPRLKYLLIDGSHLVQWITQSNPFPTLKCLVLRSCVSLREIPEVIGEIPTLELIEVEYCTTSLVESAKRIKEDQESLGNDVLQVVCRS